jgi:flagellar hook-associated protein 2
MAGIDLAVSGLASGFDWKSMVDQLTAVERQPQNAVRSEQANLARRREALGQIATRLSELKSKAEALQSEALYKSRKASSSDVGILTAQTTSDSVTGAFSIAVTSVATASVLKSGADAFQKVHAADIDRSNPNGAPSLQSVNWGRTFTPGTFSISTRDLVSGVVTAKTITVAATETIDQVFDKIYQATGVEAAYSTLTDRITLTPPSGTNVVLGAPNDSSNLWSVMKLFSPATPGAPATSTSGIGSLRLSASLSAQPVANGGISPSTGTFTINGTTIAYSTSDSLASLLADINDSSAGVLATYDQSENRLTLRSKEPGNRGIVVEDTSGNLMDSLGLLDGELTEGTDLEYSINGGATQRARSNSIDESESGLTGLTLTATKTGTVTVNAGVDTETIQKAINDFITSASTVQSLLSSLTMSSRDASGKITSGILAYDQTVFQLGSSLRSLMMPQLNGPSSVVKSLEDLGFKTTGYSNEITVGDAGKLTSALESNLAEVKAFFATASTGMATRVVGFAQPMVEEITGTLPSRQKALTEQSARLDEQLAAMERRVQANRERLLASFRAMEAAQARSNQQLQYLNQKLASG